MSLRVAVVGAGYLGQHHTRVFAEMHGVQLVGVVDIDAARADEVAGRYGSKSYTDYHDVLGGADVLSIVVPTTAHYEIALDCIRARKDVFVEKPITVTVAQASELIREAERMGRILQVGHLERYNPGVIALSRMVKEPRFLEAIRISPFLSRGADVDVTLDLMIHDIDVILSLVPSPIETLRATGYSVVTDKIDEARAWIEFRDGTVALLTASRIEREKQRKLKVFQRNSCIELDYQRSEIRRYYRPSEADDGQKPFDPFACDLKIEVRSESVSGCSIDTIRPEYMEPLAKELQDFIRCVTLRERPKVSGVEGRDALEVALEINSVMR
ncbi:MAG TPA: Gfo/Idh/MocA family oxidoreductase [Thermodesulfovibrionales bacterium]|nr:Gfo/Idh/MocA family oxidoreductase [Thermodesulfovibrionales bacterium]